MLHGKRRCDRDHCYEVVSYSHEQLNYTIEAQFAQWFYKGEVGKVVDR